VSSGFGTYKVEDFLAAVASREPAPGGGGVTAVTVAAAAGLVAMAARFAADPEATAAIIAEADDLRTTVVALADDDAAAYRAVLAAFRTPRDDPGRRAGIRAALERAADVPLRIAEAGARVARLGARAAAGGNPNLAGDVRAGVLLAAAAATAAAELVRLNVELGDLDPAVGAAAQAHVAAAGAARAEVLG
ncbi:MAG: cyclodeaminase/cyclohydrolase family protein, partial [Pseudonocardia sp.]|nr:cyclodeaminase/cyclohydrolase family protein [Pseudonocardia sp.]